MLPPGGVETIGQRIFRLRRELGLTQRDISSAGVTHAHISRIEAGTRTPSVKAIRLIARKLGVTPEYLETGADIAPREELELRIADAELQLRLDTDPDAREALHAALRQARDSAEWELVMRAHAILGTEAVRRSEHAEAIEHLSAVVTSGHVSASSEPSVYLGLAKALSLSGRAQEAVQLLEDVLANLDESVDVQIRLRFLTFLSYALSDLGELARARDVLNEMGEHLEVPDTLGRVRVLWSMARVAAMEGRPRLALRDMRKAIALLEDTEDTLDLGAAHLLCAEIHLWEGATDAAERQLQYAEHLLAERGDPRDQGVLVAGQALVAARRGETTVARERAQQALTLLEEEQADQPLALYALAIAARDEGVLEEADRYFAATVGGLRDVNMTAQAAAVACDHAELLERAGDARASQAWALAQELAPQHAHQAV